MSTRTTRSSVKRPAEDEQPASVVLVSDTDATHVEKKARVSRKASSTEAAVATTAGRGKKAAVSKVSSSLEIIEPPTSSTTTATVSAAGGAGASSSSSSAMAVDPPKKSAFSLLMPTAAAAPGTDHTVGGAWTEIDGSVLHYASSGLTPSDKIAGFDIDDTIITTKSGKTFAQSTSDWRFWHPCVPAKLAELVGLGFKIVFLSNQNGISKGNVTAKDFQTKLQAVVRSLGIPVQILAATSEDKYRKPCTGMWDILQKGAVNGGVVPSIENSLYVGDAAGRPNGWKAGEKKDFSDTDRKFALNVGLTFYTPEEYFLGEKPAVFSLSGINPKTFLEEARKLPLYTPKSATLVSPTQELVIMIGFPGSGKSTFVKRHLVPHGYAHVNRDTLKDMKKCVAYSNAALARGEKVVVDNTSPSAGDRAAYIEEARRLGIPVRAFVMETTFDQATHNNYYRELITNGVHKHVPSIAYHTFKKKFEPPTPKEGFSEILRINFVPEFNSPDEEKLFSKFTHC